MQERLTANDYLFELTNILRKENQLLNEFKLTQKYNNPYKNSFNLNFTQLINNCLS